MSTRAEVVEEGAKVSRIIMWLLYLCIKPETSKTSVMNYHRGTSLSEQHNDLLCTKQDLSPTSRYVDESSPEIGRYRIHMPAAKTATLSVTTYA